MPERADGRGGDSGGGTPAESEDDDGSRNGNDSTVERPEESDDHSDGDRPDGWTGDDHSVWTGFDGWSGDHDGVWSRLDGRAGGAALVAGYLLLLGVLYRNPEQGVAAARASAGALVLFAVLPVVGVLVGVYSAAEGPYSGLALFFAGNYLAFTGVTVALLLPGVGAVVSLTGLALFALALTALVASLRAGWAYLQVEPPGETR